jgi:PAS domain S-box-containing protein
LKIKTKLQLVAVLPIIVFLAAMAVQFVLSGKIERSHAKEDIIAALGREVSDLTGLTYEYGMTQGPRAQIQWAAQYGYIEARLNEAAALAETPDEKKTLDGIRRNYKDAGNRFSALKKFDAEKGSAERLYGFRNNMVNSIILELQEILPMADKLHEMNEAKANRLGRYANIVTGLLLFTLIICIPPVLFIIVKRISGPIEKLHDGMKIIASGDMEHRVEVDSKDELGALSLGFNEMAGHIRNITVSRDELTREIDERKQAEEALRIRETALNEAQRLGQIGSWDWDAVHDIIWWSNEYYRIYGFVVGTPPPNYDEHKKAYTPESAERLDAAVKSAMEAGTPYELDLELGQPTPTTRWVTARGEVKRDANGKIWGLRGTAQNITDRRRVEQAIKDSEARYRSLFEGAPDAAVIADLETGQIIDANPMASLLTGRSRDELIGMHQSRLHPARIAAKTSESFQEHAQAARAGKISGPFEHIILRADGAEVPVEIMTQMAVMNGKPMIQGVFRDISERKRTENEIRKLTEELEQRINLRTSDLEEKSRELQTSQSALMNIVEDLNSKTEELERANVKLQDLDRMKSMFIASMSHELRTPLNSVIGFSSILLNEWLGPLTAEQKENLDIILKSGKHLLSLINDVIDVSKIEAGKIDIQIGDFDLQDLLSEAADLLKSDIAKKGLTLSLEAVSQEMHTDRRRLLQCVINLVSNAVKFTEQGHILVAARLTRDEGRGTSDEGVHRRSEQSERSSIVLPDFVEISVTDTGMGIREEDLPRLFQPFTRLVSPTQATIAGTGLGLYLTHKLATEVLKGDILCMSTYGAGSTFTIRIPARLA